MGTLTQVCPTWTWTQAGLDVDVDAGLRRFDLNQARGFPLDGRSATVGEVRLSRSFQNRYALVGVYGSGVARALIRRGPEADLDAV